MVVVCRNVSPAMDIEAMHVVGTRSSHGGSGGHCSEESAVVMSPKERSSRPVVVCHDPVRPHAGPLGRGRGTATGIGVRE